VRWMYMFWQKHQYMTPWDENALVDQDEPSEPNHTREHALK